MRPSGDKMYELACYFIVCSLLHVRRFWQVEAVYLIIMEVWEGGREGGREGRREGGR